MNAKVTVLMPVYNGEPYLSKAIESVLNQTFTDFEFLIINDGSTDNSVEIIESYGDSRICLIHNKTNAGLVFTLNKGLDLAQGEYIARMDSDDISLPERLERQAELMDRNPAVGISSAWIKLFGAGYSEIWRYPADDASIKARLIFESVIMHPAVIIRKEVLAKHGLYYSSDVSYAQDYDLWVRCAKYTRFANIDEVLLKYRMHDKKVGNVHKDEQRNTANQIRMQQLQALGIEPTTTEATLHNDLGRWLFQPTMEFVEAVEAWLSKLQEANAKSRQYPAPAFSIILAERWYAACCCATKFGIWTWRTFMGSPLSRYARLSLKSMVEFAIKCVLRWEQKSKE